MSQFIILHLLLLPFLQLWPVFSVSTHYLCHPDEALSLLQFKEELLEINSSTASSVCEFHGRCSYPKMISWNKTSIDCCEWNGVTCHEITGRVISLDLDCSRLVGLIHQNSSLFRLSHIWKLNLSFNYFYPSTISPNIRGLSSLTHLTFSDSGFEGVIPFEFLYLSKLVLLDLSDNYKLRFRPQDFRILLQNLTHIRVLSLYDMNIATDLIANWSFSSLTYLDLGYTRLHGELSQSIFQLPRLQQLILLGNENLSVSLPERNCSSTPSLQIVDLSKTNLSSDGFADSISSFVFLKSLSLSGSGLTGFFPKSICNLSKIVHLDISDNNFTGNFSSVISSLPPKIEEVDLNWNSFTGQFSSHIGNHTELTFLSLDHNFLSGTLLFNMSVLPKLRSLLLSQNAFDGKIPSWLSLLPKLSTLDLSNNAFDGIIPTWLFSSLSLSTLYLHNNNFTGQIKEFTTKSLVLIDLSSNHLNGSMEFTVFSHLYKLQHLQLSHNKLSIRTDKKSNISFPNLFLLGLSSCKITEVPSFLINSKKLVFLDLSDNELRGQIPHMILWNPLNFLNLSQNSLSGLGSLNTLSGLGSPDTLPLIQSLEVLDLSSNNFQEQLPHSMCRFKVLYILDLSQNNFAGEIPGCYGNFSNRLGVLNLAKNDLKGTISMNFPKDNSLMNLNLNANSLEGKLPRSLVNCKFLEVLDVGNNKINDAFPHFLENLTQVQVLFLRSNKFFGSISNINNESVLAKLRVLDLSCNEFTGALPLELFESFKAMKTLDKIEAVSYMGSVTRGDADELYRYPMSFIMKGRVVDFPGILTTLVVIDLSCNNFLGGIPEIIGNLISLIVLNLSYNNFSGYIPSSLGKLHFLESLDLSWNQIEGVIPWQLADLTSLEILNLSQNCLVGRIPQGKQFNTFLNDSYYGNLGLCGFPVTITCGETYPSLPPSQRSSQDDEKSCFFRRFTWKSMLIGYSFGIVSGFTIGCLLFYIVQPKWLVRNVEEICCYGLLLLQVKQRVSR